MRGRNDHSTGTIFGIGNHQLGFQTRILRAENQIVPTLQQPTGLESQTKEAFEELLRNDLEGKRPEDIKDGWFALQQIVLDELFLAIQCEMDRFE